VIKGIVEHLKGIIFVILHSMNKIILIALSLFSLGLKAQNKLLAIQMIDSLTSENFSGRGYVNDGHNKAANFIADKFDTFGLERFDSDFKQEFKINVNTFGGNCDLLVDNKVMFAGVDFLLDASCPSIQGKFDLVWLNPKIVGDSKKMIKFTSKDLSNSFLIIDKTGVTDATRLDFMDNMIHNPFQAKGIIVVQSRKFTWAMSDQQRPYPIVYIKKDRISYKNKKLELNIESKLKNGEITQNVLGYIKGSEQPDSFLVISAHYDHLGMLGPDAIFEGANDNASGTALILDLARHYSQTENKPKISILFIAFGAEEIGLLGSNHYVQKPYFPLEKIKLQINTDIMGTGDDGIMMVNGKTHPDIYDAFKKINDDKEYLSKIGARGKSYNSDHAPFDYKGVKSVFIYTIGGSKAYHDVYDTAENLTLSKYDEVFKLITDFISEYK